MNTPAPAGWYPQPDGTQRYWDGSQWTEHIAPVATPDVAPAEAAPTAMMSAVAAPSPVPATAFATEASTTGRPWFKKKRFVIPGAAVVAVIGVSAITTAGGGGTPTAEPSSTPTETSIASTSQEALPANYVAPDVIGLNLADAQSALVALGVLTLDTSDLSGQDRATSIPADWQVCDQFPKAGAEWSVESGMSLQVVRVDEDCSLGDEVVVDLSLTPEEQQAVGKAEDYLAYGAFSKKGLISQLEYEGFSNGDAEFAVEYLDVNWSDQAGLKAEEYLDYSAFSKKGLIEQLEYEGFTEKQASGAADAVDADWNEQAALKAEEYLDYDNFSRSGLIDQLIYEGFTKKQAEYGADSAGL